MNRNVIYYPYIQVPENEWFTRILIYWDQIGSIVPEQFYNRRLMGEYMYELVNNELVKPIIPNEFVDKIPNFTETFVDYVSSDSYPVSKNVLKKKKVRTFSVHSSKLDTIGDELVNLGLAIRKEPWYHIEYYTGNLFMAYLADSLGRLPQINSKPITDNIINFNAFASKEFLQGRIRPEIEEMRVTILENVLPAPTHVIFPGELIDFKDENKQELINFRNRIESILIDAAAISDPNLRSEKVSQFIIETKDQIGFLKKRMHERGWKEISLKNLFAYGTIITGLGAAYLTGEPLALIPSAVGGGEKIIDFYNKIKSKDPLNGNYAAYAVLAQKEFGP